MSDFIEFPTCGWSSGEPSIWMVGGVMADDACKDVRERQIGEANKENVQQLLSALANYPLTEKLGQAPELNVIEYTNLHLS
jgi:hypothetical protein